MNSDPRPWRPRLWHAVLLGLLAGVGIGLYSPTTASLIEPVGQIFLRAIQMIVVPLVFSSVVAGVVSLGDLRSLGRIGAKTLGIYLLTTVMAITIGLTAAALFPQENAANLSLSERPVDAAQSTVSLVDRLVQVVPTNPIDAMARGDVLAILFFAVLLAVGILRAGEVGLPLARGIASLSEIMLQITTVVMWLAPLGVMSLMAGTVSEQGVGLLGTLASLVALYFAAALTHVIVVYGGILKLVLRLPLHAFVRGMMTPMSVAVSTTSSSATLPVTTAALEENLGVPRRITGFVLPLGATLNMDGTGVYLGVVASFAAHAAGVVLTPADYATLILTATLASIGTAGIPGGSLVMVGTVLTALNLPLEVFAIIAGVDRVIDMGRTLVNVTGDATAAVWVAKSSGCLDEEAFARVGPH